jgi:hypothetical protein
LETDLESTIHQRTVCVRGGAALRTADELALRLCRDLEACGVVPTYDQTTVLDAASVALYGTDYFPHGGYRHSRWIEDDPDLSEALCEVAGEMADASDDYLVFMDDGYVIIDVRGLAPVAIDAICEVMQ